MQAAKPWNDRLVGDADSYAVRVEQYLQSLQQLVDNLVTPPASTATPNSRSRTRSGGRGAGG